MSSVVPTQPSLTPYMGHVDSEGRYLLAPLQGLPFDQMVANGEGNRHAGDDRYYRLILVHGLFGAFAFLVFTPAAIICARFLIHGPKPRLSMAGHIGFQIASIICLTIMFPAGYVAVGKENWGKNPHHIIGATIYAGMLFQAFFGAFVNWRVKQKIRKVPPLYKMLHQWLGRAIFMLGLANIPLGLYVYGSPKTLFILYAVLVFLFLLAWFFLEYLKNRGYFHKYRGVGLVGGGPAPEMSERGHESEVHHHQPDLETGYARVGTDDQHIQTPKKSRFSKLSWPFNRGRSSGDHLDVPYPDPYETNSDLTSRAHSAQSPAMGGLAPGPGRRDPAPPVPSMPSHYENQYTDSNLTSDYHSNYPNPTGLKETVLRDSTTLGPRPNHGQHLEMPEPFPQPSPDYNQYSGGGGVALAPILGGHRSSNQSQNTSYSGQPRPGPHYEMPFSPIDNGYMENEYGFVGTPVDESPRRPLPLPPHRRDRSVDNVHRGSQDSTPGNDGIQTVTLGGGEASGDRRGHPNVAVQVKLNPDGKSVTVRRLDPEEAEQERRNRSRARQERARQREMELERERQQDRRSQSRRRQDSEDRRGENRRSEDRRRVEYEEDRNMMVSPETSYSPSAVSGQSTTIAGASGGLLGRSADPSSQTNEELPPMADLGPLIGMQPVARSPMPRGVMSARESSLGSATGTAENSEIEQEIVKEQRRKKRREERAGTSQLGAGSGLGGGGGLYGPQGSDSQWT